MMQSRIDSISEKLNNNKFYIKREDLLPFAFGGNKARKADKFKQDLIKSKADSIITYGSGESNHCRIIANLAASLKLKCYIISPEEEYVDSYNSRMVKMFGAEIIKVPIKQVKDTIDDIKEKLSVKGNPYFIPGGGHGDLGTEAYYDVYNEILEYEKRNNIKFDYIFHASGTGTTQAGLVCGQILSKDFERKIVGISIARKENLGKQIVIDSVSSFLKNDKVRFDEYIEFVDNYIGDGYGKYNQDIIQIIKDVLINDGIPLNSTYTGKAYYGMKEYIKENNIKNKNILFINTGGLPLFFDNMEELEK